MWVDSCYCIKYVSLPFYCLDPAAGIIVYIDISVWPSEWYEWHQNILLGKDGITINCAWAPTYLFSICQHGHPGKSWLKFSIYVLFTSWHLVPCVSCHLCSRHRHAFLSFIDYIYTHVESHQERSEAAMGRQMVRDLE